MSGEDRPQGTGERTVRLDAGFSTVTWTVEKLDWSPIESAAGVTFTPNRRKRLIKALDTYFEVESQETMRPASKGVNRRLDAIARHAQGLAAALDTQATEGEVAVGAVWQWAAAPDPAAVRNWLYRLAVRARHHRADGKRGPTREDAPRELVKTARVIWHDAGGKGRGGSWHGAHVDFHGPLSDMVIKMIAQVAGHNFSMRVKSAIATTITE